MFAQHWNRTPYEDPEQAPTDKTDKTVQQHAPLTRAERREQDKTLQGIGAAGVVFPPPPSMAPAPQPAEDTSAAAPTPAFAAGGPSSAIKAKPWHKRHARLLMGVAAAGGLLTLFSVLLTKPAPTRAVANPRTTTGAQIEAATAASPAEVPAQPSSASEEAAGRLHDAPSATAAVLEPGTSDKPAAAAEPVRKARSKATRSRVSRRTDAKASKAVRAAKAPTKSRLTAKLGDETGSNAAKKRRSKKSRTAQVAAQPATTWAQQVQAVEATPEAAPPP